MVGVRQEDGGRLAGDPHRELDPELDRLASAGDGEAPREARRGHLGESGRELPDGKRRMEDVDLRERRHLLCDRGNHARVRVADHSRTGRARHGVEVLLAVQVPHPATAASGEDPRAVAAQGVQHEALVGLNAHEIPPESMGNTMGAYGGATSRVQPGEESELRSTPLRIDVGTGSGRGAGVSVSPSG